jgi:hypothetical protein
MKYLLAVHDTIGIKDNIKLDFCVEKKLKYVFQYGTMVTINVQMVKRG